MRPKELGTTEHLSHAGAESNLDFDTSVEALGGRHISFDIYMAAFLVTTWDGRLAREYIP